MDNLQIVREFIKDNFLFGDDRKLRDEASFLEEGIIDSTGILELVLFLEEKFGISIGDDEVLPENLDSLNAIDKYLERKMGQWVDGKAQLIQ